MTDTLRLVLAPPHPAGRPFILGGVVVIVLGLLVGAWLAWLGVALHAVLPVFLPRSRARAARPPRRAAGARPTAAWCRSRRRRRRPNSASAGAALARRHLPLVLDVHVNRMPADGTVTRIAYRHGTLPQRQPRQGAARTTSATRWRIRLPDGREIAVVQIAGLIARRIVCDVREGDAVQAGAALRHHPLRQPHRPLSAGGRPPAGRRGPDDDRRRDRDRGAGACGTRERRSAPRLGPLRHRRGPRVPDAPAARRLRPRQRPRFKGPSFNRMVPNLLTMLGLCAGLDVDALRAGRPLRLRRGGDRGCRRDRRAGRAAGAPAEGHLALRRRVRQPGRLPVLRRGPGLRALSLVAAARRRLRLHALPDVRGLHGAAAGALQRLAR